MAAVLFFNCLPSSFHMVDAPSPDARGVLAAASTTTASTTKMVGAKTVKRKPSSLSTAPDSPAPEGPLKGCVFAMAGGTVVPKLCFSAWSSFVLRHGGRLIHASDAKLEVVDGVAVTHGEGKIQVAASPSRERIARPLRRDVPCTPHSCIHPLCRNCS